MKFKYTKNNTILMMGNVLESILKSRGIENTSLFLNLNESVVEDYNLYTNMELCKFIIDEHLKKQSNISILVDFDLDGYTSGALIYLYLLRICSNLNIYPNISYMLHEKKEHGLSEDIMYKINNQQIDLLIIPDAGSNDFKQSKVLFDKGIDIVVLDHHNCSKYNNYACVVNNQMSEKIKNKSFTGVGVVYKLCKALDDLYNVKFADDYLDLVALGCIADNGDMTDLETRYYTLKGLATIENKTNHNKLICELFNEKSKSMKGKVTIDNVAFYMSPTLNCIIRGGNVEEKNILFKAFINTDDKFVEKIRGKGEVELNIQQYTMLIYKKLKDKQDKFVESSVETLSKQIIDYKLNTNEIIIINGSCLENNIYNRVIVNKIASKYKKHTILLLPNGENLSGSATGVKNKEISNFQKWCNDTKLFKFAEGHDMAFGCSIPYKNINLLYDLVRNIPSSDILHYIVDFVFNENNLNNSIVSLIGSYDYIWGNKLEAPLFTIENINVNKKNIRIMGGNKDTIKFTFNGIEFLKFKTNEEEYKKIINGDNENVKFTIIGIFKINEYRGCSIPQVIIENYDFEQTEERNKFTF